jgi:hypothetical protein
MNIGLLALSGPFFDDQIFVAVSICLGVCELETAEPR